MLYSGKLDEVASVREFALKLEDRDVMVRIYHPDPSQHLPIIMYTHGGGFVSGTLDAFEAPCRSIAHATGRVVVAVDYRLAPEHSYPAGLNDVYEVTKWVYENAEHIKGGTEHFAMMGDSSDCFYIH